MKRGLVLLVFALAALLASVPGFAGDEEVLLKADREFARATAEKGIEGFASFLADDVVLLNGGAPVVHGRQGAIDMWSGLLNDPNTSIRWEPTMAVLAESGELGYTVGQYTLTVTGENGEGSVQKGKYVTIWRKQADGGWKVVLDGGNPDGPAETFEPVTD